MYIFSWGYSPVSLFDILYLARDSLLSHLYCYFLLLLGRLLFFAMCVEEQHKNSMIQHGKISKASKRIFVGIGIVSYFPILFKLTTCKKLQFLLFQSVTCPHHTSDVHFFLFFFRLLFIDDQMKSEVLPLKYSG